MSGLLNFFIFRVAGLEIGVPSPATRSRHGIPAGRARVLNLLMGTESQSGKFALEQVLTLPRLRKNFKLYSLHAFARQRHRDAAVTLDILS